MRIGANVSGAAAARAELLRIGTLHTKALAGAAVDVEDLVEIGAARHTKPGGSGALGRSIVRQKDGSAWLIGHSMHAPHALFLPWGTRPHDIRPKNKKALQWGGPGGFRYAKVVHHPGTRGDPYMLKAADQAPHLFAARLAALMNPTR